MNNNDHPNNPEALTASRPLRTRVSTATAVAQGLTSMILNARHSVKIYTQTLHPEVYGDDALLSSLSLVGRTRKRCSIHILITDVSIVSHGHPLLALQRRLTSSIMLHKIPEGHEAEPEEFAVIDNKSWLTCNELWQGHYSLDNVTHAQERGRHFDYLWQRSESCHELRQLQL